MSRIVGDDLKPESCLRAALGALGVPFARNVRGLPGTPDLLIGSTPVFVHGCFFHGCPQHYKRPKTNQDFWDRKLEANSCRDESARLRLQEEYGLSSVVIWEHELRRGGEAEVARRLSSLALPAAWFAASHPDGW
jgi:DNA mismatch endonuclease (patch repair protein)